MNLITEIKDDLAAILRKESDAISHYILGLETDIPRSDIITAMKIHKVMLDAKAEELEKKP